jgi:nitroreductase
MTAGIDAGHCSQNVYLYGAAASIAVVVRTSIDRVKMAEILGLRPQQLVIMVQTIGYPKIKKIEHLDYLWDECSVPMIGCVVQEPSWIDLSMTKSYRKDADT